MIIIKNESIGLYVNEDGHGLHIDDLIRGVSWELDEETCVYEAASGRQTAKAEKAEITDNAIICYWNGEGEIFKTIWRLYEGYLEVTLDANLERIKAVALPGSFKTEGSVNYLLPIMQGMYWNGKGEDFEQTFQEAGHIGFTMPMFAKLVESGGFLCIAETQDDCNWWAGKKGQKNWCTNIQYSSLGSMRYDRKMRIYLTPPTISAVAKQYRKYVISKNRFISWEEKLEKRPALDRLFGAAMCFIGYCQDDLDYAAQCQKLKDYGFDRAFLFPVRFNTYSKNFLMGGQPPINLDKETVLKIKQLGYDVAPWSWINEGMDDGGEIRNKYKVKKDGSLQKGWQIDDYKWYQCCTAFMNDFEQNAINNEMSDMTWDHFDVITCATNDECYAKNHEAHLNRSMSKTEDRMWLRKLLKNTQLKGRVVSSENFNDAYSLEYDIGSVKAYPQFGHWQFWPVPLTMLVYHDSMLHIWWEPHSYNSNYFGRDLGKYQYGGGKARLMSAMDGLYGCPPDIFPFGAQYGWTGKGSETFLYKFRIDDPETQLALHYALPVAKSHRKNGKLEMTDFKFCSKDGNLQETTFADGTRIMANFSNVVHYNDEFGSLQAESWKVKE